MRGAARLGGARVATARAIADERDGEARPDDFSEGL